MTVDEFKAQDQTYFNQGLRITTMDIDNGKFAAVWRPGSGAQWWKSGMTAAEIEAQDQTYFNRGFALTALAIESGKYAAVWQPGSGAQWWSHSRCAVDLKTEDTALFRPGAAARLPQLQDQAAGAYHYPWKSGDTRTVAQGKQQSSAGVAQRQPGLCLRLHHADRHPDPRDPRRHRRMAAGEFDKNYNPTQPTTAANTPFPAGSLQNWGNAVRIRHSGPFTSWYFHIQTNGVIVRRATRCSAASRSRPRTTPAAPADPICISRSRPIRPTGASRSRSASTTATCRPAASR